MYSRNMRNGARITPPPGYVGSAFSDEISVKYHEPADDGGDYAVQEKRDSIPQPKETKEVGEQNALSDLIRTFRGRIGTEEIIILLVMLLTSSEGVRPETLILALVLLAR